MPITVHYVPHTHYDAEVFLSRDETFEIGYSVLFGALAAMRADPTFKFVLDQTCYVEPFLRAYPEERPYFDEMIREGRLEIACGMHAMPDVNIPSGESFIRQVLSGKGYYERELGLDPRTGWLLDTFGQHPQIPQLMAGCGFDWNLFQRLGTFDGPTEYWWKGLDGTLLFCHWLRMSYAALFGAPGTLHEFKPFADVHLEELKKHALTPHILALSGADLTPVQPHVSRLFEEYNRTFDDVRFVISTPREYLELVRGAAEFPTLEHDLNPVFQGCYSARIALKQWNRRLEAHLGDAEIWDAAAGLLGSAPQGDALAAAWEPVLFNQFHDIICGSNVDRVYANAMDRNKASDAAACRSLQTSLDHLAERIDTTGEGVPIVVFNQLSWDRDDVVECRVGFSEPDVMEIEVVNAVGELMDHDLTACERYGSGGIKRAGILFIARSVPAMGHEVFRVRPATGAERPASPLKTNQPPLLMSDTHRATMENDAILIEVDTWNGAIRRLLDKSTGWEIVPEERPYGGTVVRELDNGNFWEYNGHCKGDALIPMNREHPLLPEGDARAAFSHHYGGDGRVCRGRARMEFNVSFAFGKGHFATRIRIYPGLPRVDIHTRLINDDERVRYRMALPTTLAAGTITHEIPFGAIDRPRGEFPAQNWIDYSDGQRGIGLINRGLPGNNVHDGVVMLSLLKCTALKEGYGEVGGFNRNTKTTDGYEIGVQHAFDYALTPHAGDWRAAEMPRRGLEFNRPLTAVKTGVHSGELPARWSLARLSAPNVIISAIRRTTAGTVIRVYEAEGRATDAVTLTCAAPASRAVVTDLLEKPSGAPDLPVTDGAIRFDIGPWQIRTFRLEA